MLMCAAVLLPVPEQVAHPKQSTHALELFLPGTTVGWNQAIFVVSHDTNELILVVSIGIDRCL